MKKKLTFLICLLSFSLISLGQEKKGTIIGKVFFNYHADFTKDTEQKKAFEVTRAYFGYKYKISDKFSSQILLDAGKNNAGSAYTVFIKNAKLDYKPTNWVTLTAGIFGLKQFKVQEDFWGYRYLYKTLEDEYAFGTSADVGIMGAFKILEKIDLDFLILNGEGYRNIQDDTGNNRYAINFIYRPIEDLTLKAYYDTMRGEDYDLLNQNTTSQNWTFFMGYKFKDVFRIGAEYNLMLDGVEYNKPAKGKDLTGISVYAIYNFNEKWNVFARYDDVFSNTTPTETDPWNIAEDANTIIAGVEFNPVKFVHTSINFRYTDFDNELFNNASKLYFNLEFSL